MPLGVRKYFKPVFVAGPYILFHNLRTRYISKHKDKYSFEERYELGLKYMKKIIQGFDVKFHVEGMENFKDGHSLVIANHQSYFDPLIGSLFPFPCINIAKKEIGDMVFVRHVANMIDTIYMDKLDLRGFIDIVKQASSYIENNIPVWIQPEGTRSKNKDFEMNEFKPGSFHIAYKNKASITPIAVDGTYKVFDKIKRKTVDVFVYVFPQLSYEEYKDISPEDLARKLHDMIEDKFHQLRKLSI